MASTNHYYDVWHMAKCKLTFFTVDYHVTNFQISPYHMTALKKKLNALSKEKDCELVQDWKKSVINHLYWSAVSTPSGDGEMMRYLWITTSIINTADTGNPFQNAGIKPWEGLGGRKNGSSHVRKSTMFDFQLCFLVLLIDTKASEKISSIINNS